MKKITSILLVLFTIVVIGQNEDNYFVKANGEKVFISMNSEANVNVKLNHLFDTNYSITRQYFWYQDTNGKLQKRKQSKMAAAYLDGKYYSNLRIAYDVGPRRLHEIIAENDQYILSQYFHNGFFFCYLTDKSTSKFILRRRIVSRKNKADRELFDEIIKPYFKECELLTNAVYKATEVEYNINNRYPKNHLFGEVSNLTCE